MAPAKDNLTPLDVLGLDEDKIEVLSGSGDPMVFAAEYHLNKLFKWAIQAKAKNKEDLDSLKNLPDIVFACIAYKNIPMLEYLLEIGCEIPFALVRDSNVATNLKFIQDNRHIYPFHILLRQTTDEETILQYLANNKVDLTTLDYYKLTPYQVAKLENASEKVLSVLLSLICEQTVLARNILSYGVFGKLGLGEGTLLRINIPIRANRVYFECVLEGADLAGLYVNVVSKNWIPSDLDMKGMRLHSTEYTANSVVGYLVDLSNRTCRAHRNGHYNKSVNFEPADEYVPIVYWCKEQASRPSGLSVRLDDSNFRYKRGLCTSLALCGNGMLPKCVDVFMDGSWRPLVPSADRYPGNYYFDWTDALQENGNSNILRGILTEKIDFVRMLMDDQDEHGRRAIDIASVDV